MKSTSHSAHGGSSVAPALAHALRQTAAIGTLQAPPRLPAAVRFRACGAVRAWQHVFDTLPGFGKTLAALRDATVPPHMVGNLLEADAAPYWQPGPWTDEFMAPIPGILLTAAMMLCFWMRQGRFYEPSRSLDRMLASSDIAHDLPLSLLKPPVRTLCIVPPPEQRQHCAGAESILVFQNRAISQNADGQIETIDDGALLLHAFWPTNELGATSLGLMLLCTDESKTVRHAVDEAVQNQVTLANRTAQVNLPAQWAPFIDYVAKVLLYLSLNDAVLREERPYSVAPKVFAGLGKRRRNEKLAELEQLYDRYIVGSESLLRGDSAGHSHHDVSAHWRRGHFRLQPHGPQLSLRKVIFVAPTLVRADRLSPDAPE